jgi:hypothetical protein
MSAHGRWVRTISSHDAQLVPGTRLAGDALLGDAGAGHHGAGDLGHVVDGPRIDAEALCKQRSVLAEGGDEGAAQRVVALTFGRRLLEQEARHDAEQQAVGRAGLPHRLPEGAGLELAHHADGEPARQHGIDEQRRAAVEDRPADHAAVVGLDAVEGIRPHGVELGVAAHHALGVSGGAGGVHDGVEVPGLDRLRQLQQGRLFRLRIDQRADVAAFDGGRVALAHQNRPHLAG